MKESCHKKVTLIRIWIARVDRVVTRLKEGSNLAQNKYRGHARVSWKGDPFWIVQESKIWLYEQKTGGRKFWQVLDENHVNADVKIHE